MSEISVQQIFEAKNLLTLEAAQSLIGKKIAVTNEEYKANHPSVRIGVVKSIESEWDLAAKEDISHLDNGKWSNRQEYWKSYMSEKQIEEQKSRLKVVSDTPLYCTYSELYDFFFGSDMDRPIFYVIVE